jgi:hypothetical protein
MEQRLHQTQHHARLVSHPMSIVVDLYPAIHNNYSKECHDHILADHVRLTRDSMKGTNQQVHHEKVEVMAMVEQMMQQDWQHVQY